MSKIWSKLYTKVRLCSKNAANFFLWIFWGTSAADPLVVSIPLYWFWKKMQTINVLYQIRQSVTPSPVLFYHLSS